MAVPGSANWQSQILGAPGINAPLTRQNFNALDAWQRAEGGTALNNPFNTTQTMPGSTAYNNVPGTAGVQNYSTPGQGIAATIATLTNGRYGSILDALRQGNNAQAVASAVGASPWGTSGRLMSQILGGSPVPAPTTPGAAATLPAGITPPSTTIPSPSLPSSLTSPSLGLGILGGLQSGNLVGGIMSGLAMGGGLPGLGGSMLPTAGAPKSVPLGGAPAGGPAPKLGVTATGDPIPAKFQTSIGGLHPTEGLPGFPAHDYFAPAGSPAVAPVTGTIVKLSGTNPSAGPTEGPHGPFGWSVYVQGSNGRTYYMTHMGTRDVEVGQTVKAGQVLGTVGDYAKYGTPSHIHMGVSAPGVQVS
jgi:murein DD-endopeptidase MepM/ murein hydrolase activator NlpD